MKGLLVKLEQIPADTGHQVTKSNSLYSHSSPVTIHQSTKLATFQVSIDYSIIFHAPYFITID